MLKLSNKLLSPWLYKPVSPRVVSGKRLRRAIRLSQLSYNTPDEMTTFPLGMCDLPQYHDGCRAFYNRSCQAYVWRMDDDTELCVSFRGTASMDDMLDALNAGKTRVNLQNNMDLDKVYLHSGYLDSFMSVQSALQRDVINTLTSRHSIKRLHFVGHSAGACVAQIAALYFGSILLPSSVRIMCTAIGTPKSGTGSDFEEAFRVCAPDSLILVNNNDIIPSIPFWFKHPVPIYVMQDGQLYVKSNHSTSVNVSDGIQCTLWKIHKSLGALEDHRLDAYLTSLAAIYGDVEDLTTELTSSVTGSKDQ